MLRHIFLVATMATTGTAGSWTITHGAGPSDTIIAAAGEFATRPAAPWQADDPADSLYRPAARRSTPRLPSRGRALPRRRDRYPKSAYVGDAIYYEAFSLFRIGDEGDLR